MCLQDVCVFRPGSLARQPRCCFPPAARASRPAQTRVLLLHPGLGIPALPPEGVPLAWAQGRWPIACLPEGSSAGHLGMTTGLRAELCGDCTPVLEAQEGTSLPKWRRRGTLALSRPQFIYWYHGDVNECFALLSPPPGCGADRGWARRGPRVSTGHVASLEPDTPELKSLLPPTGDLVQVACSCSALISLSI